MNLRIENNVWLVQNNSISHTQVINLIFISFFSVPNYDVKYDNLRFE